MILPEYPLVALLEGQSGGRYPPFYPLLVAGRKKRGTGKLRFPFFCAPPQKVDKKVDSPHQITLPKVPPVDIREESCCFTISIARKTIVFIYANEHLTSDCLSVPTASASGTQRKSTTQTALT